MADISSITLPNNGGTYNFKDKLAYRLGEDLRHRNSSISQDPQYRQIIANKIKSETFQTIKAIAGVGDWFYALHLNPDYTITSNYSGSHGAKGNFNISTLFYPSSSHTCLLDVTSISQTPFVLTIMKNSGNITATDVVNLELYGHTLGDSGAKLTNYKVELYTTGSTASSGTYSWQTVYERNGVSDRINGLTICLNPTSYAYLYFSGIRFTISGGTPGSTNTSAWNYNAIDLTLFQLTDQRPAFSAARAVGALDIAGGEVLGATTFRNGITGNLTGNASTATNASKVNNHTVNSDVPSNAVFTDTHYTATTSKLVTTTVPNVTSVGSAPTLGTAIAADDITAWSTNTPTSFSVSGEKLTIITGTAASLSYTSRSIPNVTSVGSAPTLGTAITVATGSLNASASGASVATGITAS